MAWCTGRGLMHISVKADIDKVTKHLNYLEKKQIPHGASVGINNTAYKTKLGLDGSTKQYIDRPSPFSQKPTAYKPSTKRNLIASVFVKPRQHEYLKHIIYGTSERGQTVPTKGKRNKYGHLPRTYVKTRKVKPNFFSGKPKGGGKNASRPKGLYERTGKNQYGGGNSKRRGMLKLHATYADTVSHRKIWPFHKIAKRIVDRHFKREMDKAMAHAIRTAK